MKRKNLLLVTASAAVLCAGLGMTACWGGEEEPKGDVELTESFELLADGTYELTSVFCLNRSTGEGFIPEEYTIPSEHKGIPVTSVANAAIRFISYKYSDYYEYFEKYGTFPDDINCSVTIPAGIKHLGYGSIEATTVYWNAVSVEDEEYNEMGLDPSIVSYVKTVVFGEGVERIPAWSFASTWLLVENDDGYYDNISNSNLTNVTLSDSIKEIGTRAFSNCYLLENINFPEHLTTIGETAFYGSGLTSVTIPDSVTSIGEAAFNACKKLTSITVPFIGGSREENRRFAYICRGDNSTATPLSVTVTGGTDVPEYAFSFANAEQDALITCDYIESITLPETVTSIGASAFKMCDGLKEINIPHGVTAIGEEAFQFCRNLTNITLPDGLQFIGERAFEDSGIEELILPEGITEIKNDLFSGYPLKKLTLPNGLTKLNAAVLEDCKSLESLTMPYVPIVDENGKEQTSLSYLFYQQSEITYFNQPYNIPQTLTAVEITKATELGDYALFYFEHVKSITLPDELQTIGEKAFSYCGNLEAVNISDISAWCGITFKALSSNPLAFAHNLYLNGTLVTNLTIPDEVTSIGNLAFAGCSAEEIILPDGLTSIGFGAFAHCSNLNSIIIPEQITSITDVAFTYCESLTSVTLPDGLQSIGEQAFYNCSSLTRIALPENLTAIGDSAFYGCGLEEFTVPLNVTLGERVFRDCGNLHDIYYKGDFADYIELGIEITYHYARLNYHLHLWNGTEYYEPTSAEVLPSQLSTVEPISSLTEIICKYEEGCSSIYFDSGYPALETVKFEYFEGEIKVYNLPNSVQVSYNYNIVSGTENGFDYVKRGSAAMLTAYSGDAEQIILPTRIDGTEVTTLNAIFKNNTAVKEVIVPEGYTKIADEAFYGCTALEIVYIPSTITQMGENVFYNNNMVYNAPSNLPFANDGSYILSGIYTSLSSLSASTGNWTDKAYFIHKNSHFDADSKIIYEYGGGNKEPRILRYSGIDSTVTVPATIENIAVKEIYYFAFYGIQTLNSVILPEGIESIGKSAFEGCSALQNVSLPQSLTTIAAGAFKGCSNLTTITIPRAVKMIGDHVFTDCSALASISFEQPIGWTSYTFTNAGANIDSAQSHDMSDAAECVTVLRDSYAERMFVNSGANTTV